MKRFYFWLFFFLITACGNSYQQSKMERKAFAEKNQGPIVIGISWPYGEDYLIKGVQLAQKEINDAGGLLGGRPIETIIDYRESAIGVSSSRSFRQKLARQIASSFAKHPELIAVIGHSSSSLAIPASVSYQNYGILYLAPTSTNIMLTSHYFDHIFRLIPNNEALGQQIAAYCHYIGQYKEMVVLNSRSNYGEELAGAFIKSAATQYGIKMVYRRSFFDSTEDFSKLLSELRSKSFEAIFLSAGFTASALLIKQSRKMGVKQPFVGGDGLNVLPETLWNMTQGQAEKAVTPTLLNPSVNTVQQFIKKFKSEYQGLEPDQSAALGYDAIRLLAYAIKKTESTKPLVIATKLRYMPFWIGVTGVHQFKENGEISGKKIFFQKLQKTCNDNGICTGQFEFQFNAHIPYIIELIKKNRKKRNRNER